MEIVRNIAIKILLLCGILLTCSYIYSIWFFEKDLQKYSPEINTLRQIAKEKAAIVYCGESSNLSSYKDDKDKRNISEFLNEFTPQRVMDISKEASHAGTFYPLLRAIPEPNSIKTIVVTMNLRSFGPDWINSNLESTLQKELVLLRPYPPLINRILLGFKNYDTTPNKIREKRYKSQLHNKKLNLPKSLSYATASEWEKDIIKNGEKLNKALKTDKLRELASQYVKSYAFHIDLQKNPRIKDFDKIVALAQKKKWKVVFHILPENVERANQLVGKELVAIMTRNSELLQRRYSSKTVQVVNNIDLLKNEQYIDQNWTTEHYKEFGRKCIAEKINAALFL